MYDLWYLPVYGQNHHLKQIIAHTPIAMSTCDPNIGYDGLALVTRLFNLLNNMLFEGLKIYNSAFVMWVPVILVTSNGVPVLTDREDHVHSSA